MYLKLNLIFLVCNILNIYTLPILEENKEDINEKNVLFNNGTEKTHVDINNSTLVKSNLIPTNATLEQNILSSPIPLTTRVGQNISEKVQSDTTETSTSADFSTTPLSTYTDKAIASDTTVTPLSTYTDKVIVESEATTTTESEATTTASDKNVQSSLSIEATTYSTTASEDQGIVHTHVDTTSADHALSASTAILLDEKNVVTQKNIFYPVNQTVIPLSNTMSGNSTLEFFYENIKKTLIDGMVYVVGLIFGITIVCATMTVNKILFIIRRCFSKIV